MNCFPFEDHKEITNRLFVTRRFIDIIQRIGCKEIFNWLKTKVAVQIISFAVWKEYSIGLKLVINACVYLNSIILLRDLV